MIKKIIFILLSILCLLMIMFGLFKLSKSRNFQLFGGMINHIQADQKIVALTFDDGPTSNATKVLDILSGHGIKASFFLIGNMIEVDTGTFTKQIMDQGHQVGNHSYSHKRMIAKSWSFIQSEIDKTDQIIRSMGYTGDIYFRTPYGKRLVFATYQLWKKQKPNIFFDIEPETYFQSSGDILRYVQQHLRPGGIILLHPMYGGEDNQSLQVLDDIISYIQSSGYQFVTVEELLQQTQTQPKFWFR